MTSPVDEKQARLKAALEPYMDRFGPEIYSRSPINLTENWNFLQGVEDANPVYWSEEVAKESRFGRIIAPSTMIWTVFMDHWWAPEYVRDGQQEEVDNAGEDPNQKVSEILRTVGGYTTGVNASREDIFVEPYGPGDGRLKAKTKVAAVSDEKSTAVGRGVFVTTEIEYRTEKDDRLVVIGRNVLLHYNPAPKES